MDLFLDANAHVPLNPEALKKYISVNNSKAGHGHAMSPSVAGRAAANVIEEARTKIAELLGAQASNQIIFTSTCTQACEWGISILSDLAQSVYSSPTEHPATKQATNAFFNDHKTIVVDKDGVIVNCKYPDAAVVCIYVQNEIGIIQPIENIECKHLFSDMSQAPGKIEFNLSSLNVNIAPFGSHKFGGPGGVGFLYLQDTYLWKEFGTGSRYFLDRSGTPDAASVAATAVALEEAVRTLPERQANMKDFRDTLETGLKELGYNIVAEEANRALNTTFVHMPNGKGMMNMLLLGDKGIHVGLGSACGAAYTGASPLMETLGIGGGPHDYMRISTFGEYTSKEAKLFIDQLRNFNKGSSGSSKDSM